MQLGLGSGRLVGQALAGVVLAGRAGRARCCAHAGVGARSAAGMEARSAELRGTFCRVVTRVTAGRSDSRVPGHPVRLSSSSNPMQVADRKPPFKVNTRMASHGCKQASPRGALQVGGVARSAGGTGGALLALHAGLLKVLASSCSKRFVSVLKNWRRALTNKDGLCSAAG